MATVDVTQLHELLAKLTQDGDVPEHVREGAMLMVNDLSPLVADAMGRNGLSQAAVRAEIESDPFQYPTPRVNTGLPEGYAEALKATIPEQNFTPSPVIELPEVVRPVPAAQKLDDLEPKTRQLCLIAMQLDEVLKHAGPTAAHGQVIRDGAPIVDALRKLFFEHVNELGGTPAAGAIRDLIVWYNRLAQ